VTITPPKVLDALAVLEPEGDTDAKVAKVVEEAPGPCNFGRTGRGAAAQGKLFNWSWVTSAGC
jgi:hypothetical protein